MKLKDINFFDLSKSIILIFIVIFALVNYFNLTNKSVQFQKEIVSLQDNIIKITNSANNKNLKVLVERFDKDDSHILNEFKKSKKETREVLKSLGEVKSKLKQTRKLYQSSDSIYNKPGMEDHHYFYKEITKDNAKIAWVMFYPNRSEDKRWKFGTFPINVDTKVLESENRDGTFNRYAEVNVFDRNNVSIPVKVSDISWETARIKTKSFDWWNPRLGLALTFDSFDPSFGLNFSFSSYGKTQNDMDFRFLTSGITYDNENFKITAEPVSYNIGKLLPIIDNIFIGPLLTYGFENDIEYGVQASIPF